MAIRLINVVDYAETLGRRRDLKFGQFDQVTCIFTGPISRKDVWVPQMGSSLPGYPLMLATACSDIEQDGALGTLTVTYTGRMYINGFQPTPKFSINSTETSASVQLPASQIVSMGKSQAVGVFVNGVYTSISNLNALISSSGAKGISEPAGTTLEYIYGQVGMITRYGWATMTINYISTSVTAKYQTLTKPNGPMNPSNFNAGASVQIISFIVGQVSGVERTTDASGVAPQSTILNWPGGPDWSELKPPETQLICTAFTADQSAGSQYDCSETWERKYIDVTHLA